MSAEQLSEAAYYAIVDRVVTARRGTGVVATQGEIANAAYQLGIAHRQPDCVATPEGYVLVPVEPTQEMLNAGYEAGKDSAWSYKNCYAAMIAAAQKESGK